MRRRALLLAAPLLFPLLRSPVADASSRADRKITVALTPEERAVVEDARDDKLDRYDLVTAAIAASPSSADVKERALSRWNDFVRSISSEAMARPPRARAEWLLATMHGELLNGGYAFYQNDVAQLLDDGTFNCVTSAIVYVAAAEHFGLDVRGVIVPSHVYVRLVLEGVDYDIETTSPRGFLLDRDDAAYAKFLADMRLNLKRRGTALPGGESGEPFYRRELDPIDLIAVLFANRGAQQFEAGKTAAAVDDFARSALLAKDDHDARASRDILLGQMAEQRILKNELHQARELFAFAIRDPGADPKIAERFRDNIAYCWALEAKQKVDKHDYEGALAAFASGSKWSHDEVLRTNAAATYNQWGLEELSGKRYSRASQVFLRAHNEFPSDPVFTQNLRAVYYEWARAKLAAKKPDDALATMRELRKSLPKDAESAKGFASIAVQVAAAKRDASDWDAACAAMDAALDASPDYPDLRSNVAAFWTNAGVAWKRAGMAAKAVDAWERALKLDPTNDAARKNLDHTRQAER